MPIFYINLSSRVDRRAFMEEQFARLGLSAERVEAVSTADIAVRRMPPSRLSRMYLAIGLSHESVWALMLSRGIKKALILEDDAILSQSLPAFIAALGDDSSDLIRIETIYRPSRVLAPTRQVIPSVSIRPSRSTEFGAAGYIISARGAQTMLDSHEATRTPVDIALYCPFLPPGRKLGHMVSDPALCVQLIATESRGTVLARTGEMDDAEPAEVPPSLPAPSRLRRFANKMAMDIPKTVDHFWHLPRGLEKKVIPFRA